MKNNKKLGDYRKLRAKVYLHTVLLVIGAFIFIIGSYQIFFHGRLANVIVGLFQFICHISRIKAEGMYQRLIRNNMDMIFIGIMLIVFLVVLVFYLRWFTKYFYDINRGIDELANEDGKEISLLPELSATEDKLNQVKMTLAQRKKAAKDAEQRKSELIIYLAHDLKTPLTSVIGYLTLLNDESQIAPELREKYLAISLKKAERLEELINEFFEITRLNMSNIPLDMTTVNLTMMLEQIVYEFQPMLQNKHLTCKLNAKPGIMINCDVNKIQRVFDNLLRNAVNYSNENSEITVSVEQSDEKIEVFVSNHGETIAPEKLNKIFEQFYRLDTSRTTKSGGAGLGLAIAKEIVTRHGGNISASSENEMIEFKVSLPLPKTTH